MKVIVNDNDRRVIRFERGEELIDALSEFSREQNIKSAFFYGFGATTGGTVASYNIEAQKYMDEELDGEYEIINITGDITKLEGQPFVHAHGIFSYIGKPSRGGHIKRLIIGATCEMFMDILPKEITRTYDANTGLKLMT